MTPLRGHGSAIRLSIAPLADGRVVQAAAGFDSDISTAPKSVSVCWALSGDDRFLKAHDVAVTAVLAHLERFGSTIGSAVTVVGCIPTRNA